MFISPATQGFHKILTAEKLIWEQHNAEILSKVLQHDFKVFPTDKYDIGRNTYQNQSFLRGIKKLKLHCPCSSGWPHTHGHMGSTNWNQWIIYKEVIKLGGGRHCVWGGTWEELEVAEECI